MKNRKIVTCLLLSLILLFGNVLSVSAEETPNAETPVKDEDKIFYDGLQADSDGMYLYTLEWYTGCYASTGIYTTTTLRSSVPLVLTYDDLEGRYGKYHNFNIGTRLNDNGDNLSHINSDYTVKTYRTGRGKELSEIVLGSDSASSTTSIAGIHVFYEEKDAFISTNIPIFNDKNAAINYIKNGDDSGVTNKKPFIDKAFYLKNVGYTVRAENSSEYPDETFIKFTWDTDNLKNGDLLEIKTKNHYTKIGGDQVIGFHDFITSSSGVDCYSGFYEMSQTDAVKAWFKTVENKPLVFKDYDTDIYFLRPVRGNQYGLWTRVTMGRKTPTSSPYIKDIEYGDLSPDGDWTKDEGTTNSEGGNHGIDQDGTVKPPTPSDGDTIDIDSPWELIKYLFNNISTLISYFGQLPQLINAVIGWLPNPIILFICGSIVLVIILRIFGR